MGPARGRGATSETRRFRPFAGSLDFAILKAPIEDGLYKRPIEKIAAEFQDEPLAEEVGAVVIAAWQRGGLLPRATIEEMLCEWSEEAECGNSNLEFDSK